MICSPRTSIAHGGAISWFALTATPAIWWTRRRARRLS
ncbi:GlyGly-CTERM sorting domain-containing protein [Prevotella sp.]